MPLSEVRAGSSSVEASLLPALPKILGVAVRTSPAGSDVARRFNSMKNQLLARGFISDNSLLLGAARPGFRYATIRRAAREKRAAQTTGPIGIWTRKRAAKQMR